MYRSLPLLLFFMAACGPPPSYPLEPCDGIELCSSGFECLGFRCVQTCKLEGDCDLGFRCDEGYCLESCEEESDCTMGRCFSLRDNRRGSACHLVDLPVCNQDAHCGFNALCIDGRCEAQCWTDDQCPSQECEIVRENSGYCKPVEFVGF